MTIDEAEVRLVSFVKTEVIAKVVPFLDSVFPNLSPNTLTLLGIVLAFLASLLIVWQGLVVSALLVFLSSLPDAFDGEIARAKGKVTSFGAVFDDTCDRSGEMLIFAAIFWVTGKCWSIWVVPISSFFVSYLNATAKANGFKLSSGKALGRPGRVILLPLLMALSYWFPISKTLWLIVLLNTYVLVKRFLNIYTLFKQGQKVQKQSG